MSPNRCAHLPHRPAKPRKNANIRYKCSSDHLLSVMNLINGNDKLKAYVEEIGFRSFFTMADADVGSNKDLTLWLIEKFNCDTEALEFEGGISIPVRPLVKSVLGIPSGPIQVVEGLHVDDALHRQYTCNSNAKTVKEVMDEMFKMTDKEPFCIGFMMVILAIYLAPNTSSMVNRKLLGAVKQVDKLKEMDWCDFVATYLFKGIKEFKESNVSFVYIKGCVHILSVIFIDFVKHAAFEVPAGFPRLGVITAKHFNWVVSHPYTSLMVRHPEESIYAAVLGNMPLGKCVDSETNTQDLSDNFATTDTNQNENQHSVSAELDTAMTSSNTTSLPNVQYVQLPTSTGSAAPCSSLTGHIIFPRGGKQVQSSKPSEPCSAQIRDMMDAAPDAPNGMDSGSASPIENAGNHRSAKKARVDRPSRSQANSAGGVTALDISLHNCSLCRRPTKPPVFQCNGGHLACGKCLAEFPLKRCQTCEHGGDFSSCPAIDNMVSLVMTECSHVGCKTSVPYHQLDDHENACPHAPCYCTEPACSFVGPPQVLLRHLTALHFVPVHRVHYGEVSQLRVLEPRYLLHGVEDDSAFLLTVGALGVATLVSAVCIRADASSRPRYTVKLSAKGPPLPSSAAGSIQMEMEAVTSSSRAGEVVVEELPSYMVVPSTFLGSSKEVTLDIRIDKI